MKIARIINAYSPNSFGGADIYAEKISKELARKNNEEIIITINPFKGDTYEECDNIKIYRFHPLNVSTVHSVGKDSRIKQYIWSALDIYSWYSYRRIIDILKKEKPDIVHLHTPTDVTLSAITAVKYLGLPLVFTLHDYLLLCRRSVLLHNFERLCTDKNINPLCLIYRKLTKFILNNRIDVVIAPSQFVLDLYREKGFFSNTKAVVLPHGIELSNFSNHIKDKHYQNTDINILYAGGLTKHKGVHILIAAFNQIINKNLKLHIVGSGIYEKELKCLAGNNKSIIFYGRFSNQDVQKFYHLADVVVIPSIWYETRSNIIAESFRAGVPVIASRIGAIPELVKDKHNGFLFDPGNINHLKEILESIAENPNRLLWLSSNTYDSVKEFEMSKYIEKLLGIYREVIQLNKICKTN